MQALGKLGLASGDDLLPGNNYNQRGYWEAAEVVALHDLLLSDFDRPWGAFKHLLPLPSDWMSSPSAERARGEIIAILRARLSKQGDAKAIAIKDPRMSLFLPLWQEAASKLGVTVSTIICLRNPWDVAQSLFRRDTIPLEAGRLLWLLYTATALRYIEPENTLLSYFENWMEEPAVALAQLARFTGSTPSGDLTIFEPALTTQTPPLNDPMLQRWYGLLQQSRATGQVTDRLQLAALHHLENAQHFQIWTDLLGDDELQKEMSMSLARELRHLKRDRDAQAARATDFQSALAAVGSDRDAQVERAKELLAAYQAEAARTTELRAGLNATIADRDAQVERAKELLAAYQAEAARTTELRAGLNATIADRDAQVERARDLLTAYTTEATRAADLRASLDATIAERDAQVLRAGELLAAYQTEAARSAELQATLDAVNSFRACRP